jgi:hypothetical protein
MRFSTGPSSRVILRCRRVVVQRTTAQSLAMIAAAERLLAALAARGAVLHVLFTAAGDSAASPILRVLLRTALRLHLLVSTDITVDDHTFVRARSGDGPAGTFHRRLVMRSGSDALTAGAAGFVAHP